MSRTLTIELQDRIYRILRRRADSEGTSLSQWIVRTIEQHCHIEAIHPFPEESSPSPNDDQTARERFERHFGEVDLGYPTGIDNNAIDADLARTYTDIHKVD